MILGASPDDVKTQRKFKEKYGIPFTLLADEGHATAESYGVWGEKNLFGLKRMGVRRTTFLINPRGEIAHVFEKVDPSDHGEEVARVLAAERG